MKRTIFAMTLAAATVFSAAAEAGALENLERERALLIDTFLDAGLASGERQAKIEATMPRLIDMERMVLRDDSLKGRNTPVVRRAFANYDLTFLAHASAENNRGAFDTWLAEVGFTSEAVMTARIGRKH